MPGTAIAPYENRANLSRANYQSRLDAFDPMQYFREASGAAVADALERYSGIGQHDRPGRRSP